MEDRMYTKVRNTSGGNVVISTLNGFVLTKDQEMDLTSSFKKSQLEEASGELRALINAKLLQDIADGAIERSATPAGGSSMPTAEEMKLKVRGAKLNDILGSSNVTALEDYAKDKDEKVVESAKARLKELMGDDHDSENAGSTVGIGL